MVTYFLLWLYSSATLFCAHIIPALVIRSYQLAPVSLWHTPITVYVFEYSFWSTFLLSSTIKCSKLILYISYLSPKISYFSKEPCFHLLENGVRNQCLGAGCALCYWGLIYFKHTKLTEQVCICVYTNLTIHKYL